MVRLSFLIAIIALTSIVKGQNTIEWDGDYQLQLSDFQSTTTQVGQGSFYSLHTASEMGFAFYMSNAEFMFTKNFNSKVNCTFQRDAASLVAPDSLTAMGLVNFARYEFDLSELYARKFRKKLFEEKGAFSNIGFIQPIYDSIQRDLTERHTVAGRICDLGRDKEKLGELHQEVLREIEQLSDFCKTCKPPKKKK
jgi:hypothetical protein